MENKDIYLILLLLCLLLIVLVKTIYPAKFKSLWSLLSSSNYLSEVHQESKSIINRFNGILFSIQAITYSLFLYFFFDHFSGTSLTLTTFWVILGTFPILVFIKYAMEQLLANTLDTQEEMNQYHFMKLSYRNLIGLLLIPFLLLIIYSPFDKNALFYSTVVIFLLINFAVFFIAMGKLLTVVKQNPFYFILYLCTFEIAPYIILIKLGMPNRSIA